MFELSKDRTYVMGVLNVTPDSFSDGGEFLAPQSAILRACEMMEQGADLIDVGGESTRPGSEPVPLEEELRRLSPILEALYEKNIPFSCDTSKPEVAKKAIEYGAVAINDVRGFRDSDLANITARSGCVCIVMHMLGEPRTMQENPSYRDVVGEVLTFLETQTKSLESLGVPSSRIWIDPGIGFGKTLQHNIEVLKNIDRFAETGYPVLVGVSRKSFIGRIAGIEEPRERIPGSIAAALWCVSRGVKILRVHDVKETVQALRIWEAIQGG